MPIGKFLYFGDFAEIPVAVLLFAWLALADRGLAAAPEFARPRSARASQANSTTATGITAKSPK